MSQQHNPSQQTPVGIDLGTTYSVVSYLDESGRPMSVTNDVGDIITPSAVLFEDGEVVVGKEAAKSSAVVPEAYAECFKRSMGDALFRQQVCGLPIPPAVLSGFVLEKVKHDAETRLGPIKDVVVTVPAFFDETRRKATQDAAQLAGLNPLDIINEPTAAAVAYGFKHGLLGKEDVADDGQTQRVLVYDLGGGTFDVTVLEIDSDSFRAIATDGDVQLGGKDFDGRLVNYLAELFIETHGVDPRSDPQDAAQLWLDAQEAKHSLSHRQKITVVCFHAGIRLRVEVTRDLFEELTRDLLERTETTTSLTIKQAGFGWSDIDHVLLVGGSSRMPMVVEMLRKLTGKTPDQSLSPDEAIAHGAALYCGMLMQRGTGSQLANCELVNVNSHSLGVVGTDPKTERKVNVVLIPKNTPLPASKSRNFKTARSNQSDVKVAIVEGESRRPEHCIPLGHCVIRHLPSGLPQGTTVIVEYRYDSNGRISVVARVPETRQSASVEIERTNLVELDYLDSWRRRLKEERPKTGSTTKSGSSADRATVMRRLDSLYTKIGRAAVGQNLPETLSQSQQAAKDAAGQHKRAEERGTDLNNRSQAATGSSEAIRFGAELAQSRMQCEEAKTRADFAQLVLGRECVNASYEPTGMSNEFAEIRRIQKTL